MADICGLSNCNHPATHWWYMQTTRVIVPLCNKHKDPLCDTIFKTKEEALLYGLNLKLFGEGE